jgi:hypothetical protein
MMLKLTSKSQRTFGLLAAGLFTASLCAYAIDLADARGGRGGGGGGRGGGGGNHAHNFKHGGGGGGNRGGGHHGNRHHHHGYDNWHRGYNHYGRWAAGAVAVGATAAAIGSVVYSLPSGCRTVYSGGVKYWDCGGSWYQAQYYGSNVGYVAVPPR